MARPRRLRRIGCTPAANYYKPQGIPMRELQELVLPLENFEALRLVDSMGMDQEQAASEMDVSKPTLCRMLAEARKIVASALTEGCALRIEGGNYFLGNTAEPAETQCKQ